MTTTEEHTLETLPTDHLVLAAIGSEPGDMTLWNELLRRCRADNADPYRLIAAALHGKDVDAVTPEERAATKTQLFARLYGAVPESVRKAIEAIGADPEAGLDDDHAADLEQRLDDAELVAASELDVIPASEGAGPLAEPMTVGLGEAKARAAAIEAQTRALPAGTVRHAALPVRLREHETKIAIPASPHERRITAIGVHPPDDTGQRVMLRDVVVHVLIDGTSVLSAPITFFGLVATVEGGLIVGEGTPLRPAPVIPPGVSAEVLFRAWCTLPAAGVGLVLHADVHTATPVEEPADVG